MFRTIALCLFALCAAVPAAAGPIDVEVLDREHARPLPQTLHPTGRWIVGEPGHRYSVRLTNTSGERLLVVLSIDGVNAITGETASPDQAGYVLGPGQSSEVAGWRKSSDEVAQFVFTSLADSYAARTGRPDNVGVIGIAVYPGTRPQPPPAIASPPPPSIADRASEPSSDTHRSAHRHGTSAAPSAESASAPQRLGTGHGAREWSPVSHTVFDRATRSPTQVTLIRYDARARLVALGVLPSRHRHRQPDAFPARFVADPPH
ncbi:MAG: hypothetical protein M3Q40_02720 [Pseudomonadota bacterium]|nr:hypothetical protein [Pseudomonadota bacterium]